MSVQSLQKSRRPDLVPVYSRPACNRRELEPLASIRRNFANNLGRLIRGRGLTQQEFATAVGVGESVVSHWVKGLRFPRERQWDRIAEVLHCEFTDLVIDPELEHDPTLREVAALAGYEIVKRKR